MPKKGEYQDLTGQRFTRLTVVEFVEMRKRTPYWRCKCDCGNERIVSTTHLKAGHSKSCGCMTRERIGLINKKTGLTNTRLFYVYHNMHMRCERSDNRHYRSYGERGITICEEWCGEHGFENFSKWAFANGYKDIRYENGRSILTLDRIDVNGNYEPNNCRWVDKYVQANNRRNNRHIKINGEIDTLTNMSRKYGIYIGTLRNYANGVKPTKYDYLDIEVVNETELQANLCNQV